MAEPFLLYDENVPFWTVDTFAPGLVLDVAGGRPNDGERLLQWTWHGFPNQRFHFLALRGDEWVITAAHSGRVLDVAGDGDAGSNIVQWPWHGGANQRWRLGPEEGSHFRQLINVSKGLALDVSNASQEEGAWIVAATPNDGRNQRFKAYARGPEGDPIYLPAAG